VRKVKAATYNLTDNASKILERRYYLKDEQGNLIEDAEGMFNRVARTMAEVEYKYGATEYQVKELEETFFDVMWALDFVPNSPTLMNAGTGQGTMSACYVMDIPDSMEDIMRVAHDQAMIEKFGGGIGFSLSAVRPKGHGISTTQGKACGPIQVLKVLSQVGTMITQGGKRDGAHMAIMEVYHPDIEEFIHCKNTEGSVTNFNISIGADSNFMEAVRQDKYIRLAWPLDHQFYEVPDATMDGRFVKANDLYSEIIKGAWMNGEPGMVWLDRINQDNTTPALGQINATNPCVIKGTLVNTPFGYKPVEIIKEGDYISTLLGSEPVKTVERHEAINVYRVKFSDGGEQTVTAAHQYHAIRKGSERKHTQKIRLDELNVGDYVQVSPATFTDYGIDQYKDGLKLGILLGDGNYMNLNRSIKIASSSEDGEYNHLIQELFGLDAFNKPSLAYDGSKSMNMLMSKAASTAVATKLELAEAYSYEKTLDIVQVSSNVSMALGVLDGFLATDGDINLSTNHPQIRFTTTSHTLAQQIRLLLLGLGIHGRITNSFDKGGVVNGREIIRKHTKYTVNVSGASAGAYARQSRLEEIHPVKAEKLKQLQTDWLVTGNTWKTSILSIEPVGVAEVYDLYCEASDTWITEGYVQRGCGEQPLLSGESCNLGSIHIGNFIKHNYFDEERFAKVVGICTRFLDNVVDANQHPTEYTTLMNQATRKIGLGIMGFADLLVRLNIPYDSDNALTLADRIGSILKAEADKTSSVIAQHKGNFPAFDKSPLNKINGGMWDTMRNAWRLSIAPTGTISMIANCSSGIEPLFALAYKKHNMSAALENMELFYINDDLKKNLGMSYDDVEQYLNDGHSIDSLMDPQLRSVFIVSDEIGYENHIKMQAIFQKYVDSGISKTINLPNEATEHDIAMAYSQAWESGCKGITVYRRGSREREVLVSTANNTSESMSPYVSIKARATKLVGATTSLSTGHGKMYVTVNYNKDQIYEVLAQTGKTGKCQAANTEAMGRLISTAIQYGVPVDVIIKQLLGITCCPIWNNGKMVLSLADGIGQVLADSSGVSIHANGHGDATTLENFSEIIVGGSRCPECDGSLFMSEGCSSCMECGYSKCG